MVNTNYIIDSVTALEIVTFRVLLSIHFFYLHAQICIH